MIKMVLRSFFQAHREPALLGSSHCPRASLLTLTMQVWMEPPNKAAFKITMEEKAVRTSHFSDELAAEVVRETHKPVNPHRQKLLAASLRQAKVECVKEVPAPKAKGKAKSKGKAAPKPKIVLKPGQSPCELYSTTKKAFMDQLLAVWLSK